jgi:hypothetical protein
MSTSGSVDFNLTRNDIITEAMELIGAKDIGESPTAAEITSCARTLNILIKGWQSEGIYLWKTRDFVAFPQYSESYIDLGATGGHATHTHYKTEVATAQTSGNSTLEVDSDDNITDGDYIGVELDDGTLQWTTVNGTPSSDTVTLTAALTDDVSVDANVYNYTTKINRPIWLAKDCRVSMDGGNEIPFTIEGRREYNRLSNKTSTGTPNTGFYDPQLTNGRLYLWPESNNVKNYLILTGKFPIEDFDGATNDADVPQEWYLALTWNLAAAIAPKFLHRSMDPMFEQKAAAFVSAVATHDKDWGSMYIEVEA